MKTLPFLAAFCCFTSLVHAGLQWENKRLEFHPSASDTEVKAEFTFTNTGSEPVTIEAVKPDCDCTAATLEKKIYKPAEKGRISATFNIGQRTGIQDKSIRVTIQGEKEPVLLSMVTYIPELMKITPSLVFWKTGEAPQPKTLELAVSPGTTMRITKVTSSDPRMTATVEAVEEGKKYKVVVTPQQTATPLAAILWMESDAPSDAPRKFTAFAQIRRASPSPDGAK